MTPIGTVSDWQSYAAARGDTAPASATPEAAAAALLRASDYIRATYPAAIRDPLPEVVEVAVYIAASEELRVPGFWVRTFETKDAKILTEVGSSIKWTPISSGSASGMAPRSTLIDGLLAGFQNSRLPGILLV